jgi:hypothetical protein
MVAPGAKVYPGSAADHPRANAPSAKPFPVSRLPVTAVNINQASWYGDSVGQYEGDTLVIDTVGVRTDRKYAMLDLFNNEADVPRADNPDF